jgi:hypothetical protein
MGRTLFRFLHRVLVDSIRKLRASRSSSYSLCHNVRYTSVPLWRPWRDL